MIVFSRAAAGRVRPLSLSKRNQRGGRPAPRRAAPRMEFATPLTRDQQFRKRMDSLRQTESRVKALEFYHTQLCFGFYTNEDIFWLCGMTFHYQACDTPPRIPLSCSGEAQPQWLHYGPDGPQVAQHPGPESRLGRRLFAAARVRQRRPGRDAGDGPRRGGLDAEQRGIGHG